MDAIPEFKRVTLRVEQHDGTVTEFNAEQPHAVSFEVTQPYPERDFSGADLDYLVLPQGATKVALSFEASRSLRGDQHPITMQRASTSRGLIDILDAYVKVTGLSYQQVLQMARESQPAGT